MDATEKEFQNWITSTGERYRPDSEIDLLRDGFFAARKQNYRVLDVCCGGRMFWFNKSDSRAVFVDNRIETHWLKDSSVKGGQRKFQVLPNVQADFRNLPFPCGYFHAVVFDPPHFDTTGPKSWLRAKYGTLEDDWQSMLRSGFAECFRVLATNGTLIFKWNEYQVKVSEVLKLTDSKPLFGHKSGRHSNTHWVAFTKPNNRLQGTCYAPGNAANIINSGDVQSE